MKSRRVILTLEVETDAPLSVLQQAKYYLPFDVVKDWGTQKYWKVDVYQAQANVVKSKKPGGLGKT